MRTAKKRPENAKIVVSRSQRGIYLADKIWEKVEADANSADRSVNYMIEKALADRYGVKELQHVAA